MIKRLIPHTAKIKIKECWIFMRDMVQGNQFNFAKARSNHQDNLKFTLKITQDLKSNEAKLHNLLIAIQAIEKVTILPNEIFSFWKIVKAPTQRNGFKASRSLKGDEITETIGGGLCQVSGLIYYICLLAGLEIIERHNHSMDIYTDETRFAPLGADATLVYGYKDLRFRNNLLTPIGLKFLLESDQLSIVLNTEYEIVKKDVKFVKTELADDLVQVKTYVKNELIDASMYKVSVA